MLWAREANTSVFRESRYHHIVEGRDIGATYLSIQVSDAPQDVIRASLAEFNTEPTAPLAAYLAKPVGR